MSEIVNKKIGEFIQEYFSDIDFDFQGSTKKKSEEQIWGLKYEYFINAFEVYSFKKEIDIEDTKRLSTGTLQGIDSVYLVLNGKFFAIPDERDDDYKDFVQEIDLRLKDELIEAVFYFIQVKTKDSNQAELLNFCSSVYDVFDLENSSSLTSNKIKALRNTFKKIAGKTEDISLQLKFCIIKKDAKRINELEIQWSSELLKQAKELKSVKFKKVVIRLVSGQEYLSKLSNFNAPNKRRYELSNLNDRFKSIKYDETITYIGFLSMSEILSILEDDDGNFDDNNVFFDNIRYFQGDTTVNSKILKSLNTNGAFFHTLHNGIIITSSDAQFNPSNGNLVLTGFSIVNGCQTCNMIWKWHEHSMNSESGTYSITQSQLDSYFIPAKIVITSDFELRNLITEAANTQNPIRSINLIAISDSAKLLEKSFNNLNLPKRDEKLVFQRLPKYTTTNNVLNISLEDIARAFYSTFFKEPHEVSRSFGKYLDRKLMDEDFLCDKKGRGYNINNYLLTAVASNYLLRYVKSKYVSLVSLKNHFLLLFFLYIDSDFLTKDPRKSHDGLLSKVIGLVDDKNEFDKVCKHLCEFTITNLEMFVDASTQSKPKVIPKSYYTEENTKNMIAMYIARGVVNEK